MRRVALLCISFLLSLIMLFIYSIHYKESRIGLQYSEAPYMDDIKITHKKDGIIKWHVEAKKAIFADATQVKLENLRITFPDRKLILNSDSGTYNPTNQSIKIEGNIKAETNNYTISAINLSWDASKSELSSDKKIQIVGKDFIIEGDELSASTDKARLNNNIKAVFK